MFRFAFYWLFLFMLLMHTGLFCSEKRTSSHTGTLLVTYQTGLKGEYLDRIRFFIKDMQEQLEMYPKRGAFVDHPTCAIRMVVIEDLPVGNYTLDFLIPNWDGLFEEIPSRQITILKERVVKIDQVIKIRYATLQATTKMLSANQSISTLPKITVKDEHQHVQAQSSAGALYAPHLIPGTYTLIFEPIPGWHTPAPILVTLAPNEEAGPFIGTYKTE